MRTERIFLVGAGGHGRVVLDALLESGIPSERIVIADDDREFLGTGLLGFKVGAPAFQTVAGNSFFHVAIGNDKLRESLYRQLEAIGSAPLSVLHPAASVSRFASVQAGVFVAAHAVVGPSVQIDPGVIINHGAVVDHDCVIGRYSHIAPNATLGGAVRVGVGVLVGAGATVLAGVSIGDGAVIGAGAVVLYDVSAGKICVGVPAASIKGK